MQLSDLNKSKLVALAIQFQVFSSVTEAAAKSATQLAAALEECDECVDLVREVHG